ncbi:GNAT family N-acetyltransferase [uncultured Modestobacter sp.]|uniref:GNAT family N-acetyltransferase n=1 Tax=uncultured Modestobacter sp. TaxID=380048 RepID=UPI00261F8C83|nr:GNAT family N-acetyltransferase [uncultured Modestobacter sp.]
MSDPTRLVTSADVDDRAGGDVSISALHELELADGSRVVLLDDRGWGTSGGWCRVSVADVRSTAIMVVGPDEPFGGRSQEEMAAAHWDELARTARSLGVAVDGAGLRQLPHDVALSPRLLARLGAPPSGAGTGAEPSLDTSPPTIGVASPAAAGELLTLQRAAYVSEAQLYDDVRLPALTQTLGELTSELAASTCLAAWSGRRLVGAIRTREVDDVLHVGRLVVAPDLQGLGIGSRLLAAAEAGSPCRLATLFTGSRSEANLRLYRRHGYVEDRREELRPGLEIVHLVKELR